MKVKKNLWSTVKDYSTKVWAEDRNKVMITAGGIALVGVVAFVFYCGIQNGASEVVSDTIEQVTE